MELCLATDAAPAPCMQPLPAADEVVFGCGWFDSSLDLAEGLQVTEFDNADWMAQLPLGALLQ